MERMEVGLILYFWVLIFYIIVAALDACLIKKMKKLFQITIIHLLAMNFAIGQSMETTIQNLVEEDLIKKEQVEELKSIIERYDSKNKLAFLIGLFQLEFKKLTGSYYSQFGTFLNFEEETLQKEEQDKINQELGDYLKRINNAELISKRQFEKYQTQIDNSQYFHILQLLPKVAEQVAQSERMNPSKLNTFAEKLRKGNIVTNQYDQLILDIKDGLIENPIQFINYCSKAVTINEDDYSKDPKSYLEKIHKKTSTIIPELEFTDFTFEIVIDSSISDKDSKFYDFVVQLEANGKKYTHRSSYHLYSLSQDKYFGNKIDQQEYYAIFNKILADQQSPYRLHEVKSHIGNAVNWKIFGIIALTKEQADLLHGGGVYFTPGYENFKNNITSNRIDKAISDYMKIGLLSHLKDGEIKKAKQKVAEQENRTLNDALMCFPKCIYYFDMELGNLDAPYAELIQEFANISKGEFTPSNIVDDFDIFQNKEVNIGFEFKNSEYSKTLKIQDDWIDVNYFDFIDSVIAENKLKGQFYQLYTGGQDAAIIYLTKEQYEFIRKNKLLVFGDEWESQE